MRSSASIARAAIALTVASCLSGCVTYWRPTDPRLVRGAGREELGLSSTPTTALEQGLSQLEAHLGDEFPNLTLIDNRDRVVMLDHFRGKRIAILTAVGPCPHSTDWLRALASSDWQPPTGYDELVVLVSSGGNREFNKLIRQAPSYLVGWPLTDYLAYVRWYPIMYGVDQNGRLQEFWNPPEQPRIAEQVQTMQPNTDLQLTVMPLADASVARAWSASSIKNQMHGRRLSQ